MNWDAVGAIGEIFGGFAVLITLIYLAAQVRHSNDLATFNASKELMNQFNTLNYLVATDSDLRQILMKGGELSADERERVYNFAMMFCNVWYSIQSAYDNGQINQDFYLAGCKDVEIELERWQSFRPAVEQWLANYPEIAHTQIFKPAVRT